MPPYTTPDLGAPQPRLQYPFAIKRRLHHHAPVLSVCRALQCTDAQHSHIVFTAGSTRATCRLSRRVSIPARYSLLVTPGARGIHHSTLQRIYIVSYRQITPTHPSIASHCRSTNTLFSAYTVLCYSFRRVQKSRRLPIHKFAFPSNRISSSSMLQPSFGSQPSSHPQKQPHTIPCSKHTTTRPSISIMRDSNGVSYPCSLLAHCNLYGQVHDLVPSSSVQSPVRSSPVLTTTAY